MATRSASTADSQGPAPANLRRWSLVQRRGLLLVALSPVIANLVGSAFNIWYNERQIRPILTDAQLERFGDCWLWFNLIVYPIAVSCWAAPLAWLVKTHRQVLAGQPVEPARLQRAQRTVVNLPWRILTVASVCWIGCIPVFLLALAALPEPLSSKVVGHLTVSFLTGGLIAVTHSFFAVELTSQAALFPVYFRRSSPADTPGAMPLTLQARQTMWTLAAAVSPIVILVLLLIVPDAASRDPWLAVAVGGFAICFALITGSMHARLVRVPVGQLKDAAIQVIEGDLDVRVNLLRADDFGPLIAKFNQMVEGLQERERLQETFGRHVGRAAARQILAQGDGLVGSQQLITVMFVDVRDFTAHSACHSPEEVVSALNIFFQGAVEIVEAHGGMVNKFLGDGLMALFGIGAASNDDNHALHAYRASMAMLEHLGKASDELARAGWPDLKIGIGLNSGPAIVGSIGSPRRQEYTAIGDTVNVAARVEALTKTVGRNLLMTAATRALLSKSIEVEELPPQQVKGIGKALNIFAACCEQC